MNNLKKPLLWAHITNYVYWLTLFGVVIIFVQFPPRLQLLLQLGLLLLCILIAAVMVLLFRLPDNKSGLKSKFVAFLFLFVSTVYILCGGFVLYVLSISWDFLYEQSQMKFMAVVVAGLFPVGILIFVLSLLALMTFRKSE